MPETERNERPSLPEPPEFAMEGLPLEAWRFAADAHRGQLRKGDGSPYITHPVAVARLTAEQGGDERMIAAAFLHDVIEDTEIGEAEIAARFGAEVASLVAALSDDRGISDYGERKAALRRQVERAGSGAALIYAADKLANCTDTRRVYAAAGEASGARYTAPLDVRLAVWRDDLEMVRRLLGERPIVAALASELDAFEAERAGAII